jgi:hypothetical protein
MSDEKNGDLSGLSGLSEPAKKPEVPAAFQTPEGQSYVNASIGAAVREIFREVAPLLQSIALTPEKLAAAEELRRAPTDEQKAAKAREKREKEMTRIDAEENRKNTARLQARCPHAYPLGGSSINLVRNMPDNQPRGICALCQAWITPREWRIAAPDAENPRGRPYIADAHPLYHKVLEILAFQS